MNREHLELVQAKLKKDGGFDYNKVPSLRREKIGVVGSFIACLLFPPIILK